MSLFSHLAKSLRKITGKGRLSRASQGLDASPSSRDATSAIEELSRAVQNDTDSVEIYLALGNLYRLRGDIEKAVHIRRCLIARPGLEASFRARAFFELGRDYRRGGFIDRAQNSFNDALKHGADKETVWCELAALYGDSGAFDLAAMQHRRTGNTIAEAHYLTRHAEELYKTGHNNAAQKVLKQAIKAYSGSIEAWTIRISIAIQENQWDKASSLLVDAMKHIALEKRFLIFHAILELPKPSTACEAHPNTHSESATNDSSESTTNDSSESATSDFPDSDTSELSDPSLDHEKNSEEDADASSFEQIRCDCVLPIIEVQETDLLLHYYAALFLLQCKNQEEANIWLEKAIVLQTHFWAARYQILLCSIEHQHLSPVFKGQLAAFMEQAKGAKRFVCQHCGFKRDQIFYICPKCRSWHSATFRTSLH